MNLSMLMSISVSIIINSVSLGTISIMIEFCCLIGGMILGLLAIRFISIFRLVLQ
jgi:hypothetical protein